MKFTKLFLLATIVSTVLIYACKDDKTEDPQPGGDKCSIKNITVTATLTPTSKCSVSGKIVARAGGSTGFKYQIGSGAFQSDSTFNNLAEGNYTITVKDVDGCTKSATFTIGESGAKGANYTFVKAIIDTKCNGNACHATGQDGAPKTALNTDCNIIARKNLIKSKAVDGTMGSLNSGEKQQITIWLNAGGRYTD
jgi:cytochrome c5